MKTDTAPKRHGVRKVLLIVLITVLFSIGVAAFVFRDEIVLLYKAITTSEEALSSKQVENDRKTHELLDSIAVVTMRDLTDEERQMLAGGLLTPEQALALIRGEEIEFSVTAEVTEVVTSKSDSSSFPEELVSADNTKPNAPVETVTEATSAKKEETTAQTTATTSQTTAAEYINKEKAQKRIEEIIAEIYLLRAKYLNEIDNLITNGRKEYLTYSVEKRTLTTKFAIVERMLDYGEALEKECDGEMDKYLKELEKLLVAVDYPKDILVEIRKAYDEQKQLKKTELYNQYASKLVKQKNK